MNEGPEVRSDIKKDMKLGKFSFNNDLVEQLHDPSTFLNTQRNLFGGRNKNQKRFAQSNESYGSP